LLFTHLSSEEMPDGPGKVRFAVICPEGVGTAEKTKKNLAAM